MLPLAAPSMQNISSYPSSSTWSQPVMHSVYSVWAGLVVEDVELSTRLAHWSGFVDEAAGWGALVVGDSLGHAFCCMSLNSDGKVKDRSRECGRLEVFTSASCHLVIDYVLRASDSLQSTLHCPSETLPKYQSPTALSEAATTRKATADVEQAQAQARQPLNLQSPLETLD